MVTAPLHSGDQERKQPADLDPLDRPVGRLLRSAQAADPQRVVETLSMTVAELGGFDVVLYLVDYEHAHLEPDAGPLLHEETPVTVTVEGSMAGRVFRSGKSLATEREPGWRVWVPVAERAQKLGVLSMTLPSWNPLIEQFCEELGIAAAHLVSTANGYTDHLMRLRRRENMSLAAEVQWGILPPLTFSIEGTTVAGLLEPAYDVGGDCFDYSLNDDILDVAVFDAMGHGLRSSTLGSLAVSSYRNTRRGRHPADLRTLLTDVDAVIADYAGGDAFVTATFVQLDITTGRVQWVSAGHPPPLHVRRTCLPPVDARPAPPLGLGSWREPDAFDVVEMSLEPGDGLLLYTDGVLDARDADGHEFGEARLRHLLERESASGEEPAELLRRVIHSVLNHHPGRLRDDASTLYLRWDAAAPHRR